MYTYLIRRAEIVVEALPYIQKFHGKFLVIKYGGSAMVDQNLREKVLKDIILLKFVGMNPILVHGGGKLVSQTLKRKGLRSEFIDGLRVTYPESVAVIKDVLQNKVGRGIASTICRLGGEAVVLNKRRSSLLHARKLYLRRGGKKIDLGFTGEVSSVEAAVIKDSCRRGYIPVISSLGLGRGGEFYNVNADQAAAAVAAAIPANKLILLTDVNGVMAKDGKLLSQLARRDIRRLIRNRTITGGMIPKVKCCLAALRGGVEKTHIINGKIPHALLLELFTNHGIGSMVTL